MNKKKTLALKTEEKGWYPYTVESLETHLEQLIIPIAGYSDKECRGLRKNIAYSLQYLQFIDRCIEDLTLSSVLWTQNLKTFTIVTCSVLEALFFYIIRSNGRASTTPWLSIKKIAGQEFVDESGVKLRINTELFRKVDPELFEEMNFDSMCKKIEKKALVPLKNETFHKNLPYLRQLRNRVHIHILKDDSDTDYLKISAKDYELSKRVLYGLLTSSLFTTKNANLFDYLKS